MKKFCIIIILFTFLLLGVSCQTTTTSVETTEVTTLPVYYEVDGHQYIKYDHSNLEFYEYDDLKWVKHFPIFSLKVQNISPEGIIIAYYEANENYVAKLDTSGNIVWKVLGRFYHRLGNSSFMTESNVLNDVYKIDQYDHVYGPFGPFEELRYIGEYDDGSSLVSYMKNNEYYLTRIGFEGALFDIKLKFFLDQDYHFIDGYLYYQGGYGFITKIDPNGEIVFEKETRAYYGGVKVMNDHSYLHERVVGNRDLSLVRILDPMGNEVKTYGPYEDIHFMKLENGHFYLSYIDENNVTHLERVDQNFNRVFENTYQNRIKNIRYNVNGITLIHEMDHKKELIHLDSNGHLLYSKTYDYLNTDYLNVLYQDGNTFGFLMITDDRVKEVKVGEKKLNQEVILEPFSLKYYDHSYKFSYQIKENDLITSRLAFINSSHDVLWDEEIPEENQSQYYDLNRFFSNGNQVTYEYLNEQYLFNFKDYKTGDVSQLTVDVLEKWMFVNNQLFISERRDDYTYIIVKDQDFKTILEGTFVGDFYSLDRKHYYFIKDQNQIVHKLLVS